MKTTRRQEFHLIIVNVFCKHVVTGKAVDCSVTLVWCSVKVTASLGMKASCKGVVYKQGWAEQHSVVSQCHYMGSAKPLPMCLQTTLCCLYSTVLFIPTCCKGRPDSDKAL